MTNSARPLSADEIRSGLAALCPDIPWTHHFDFYGIETISEQRDEKYYRKARGLQKVSDLVLTFCRVFSDARDLEKMRVLDIASGEGAMSIAFARAGASEVLGIEGRQLYVDRANFAARALGVPNVQFTQGDVRRIRAVDIGEFDFVIASGILHHLAQDDFWPFLESMAKITSDTLFLYTHISTPEAVQKFRLNGPVIAHGATGYLFREHADDATPEQRRAKVRASLDITFSFWATEDSLLRALTRVGFKLVTKVFEPHAFSSYADRNLRAILIAKRS